MLALTIPVFFAAFDLGTHFAKPAAWTEGAVDFAVEHQSDGFGFASQKRDVVNCMRRGGCTWHGLDVWEARVYYGAEGATRVEMSLYNRGDDEEESEGLDASALGRLLDAVAAKAEPGGKIDVNRVNRRRLGNGGVQLSKSWTRGDCNVDLAWGVSSAKAKDLTADFVRVTMYPKTGRRPRSAATSAAGSASRAKVKENVRKTANGDVWIDNVPMVDQGQKGYCTAAASERVLRYYGFDIDQHEIAQIAGTTSSGGTSVEGTSEVIRAVCAKCRLSCTSIVSMVSDFRDISNDLIQYNRAARAEGESTLLLDDFVDKEDDRFNAGGMLMAMKPKLLKKIRMRDARYRKFLSGVRSQIDQGVPVVWGVVLGHYPEPGLPQTGGGHTRLIIGYNQATREILYTDTWGAGHELKRMPEDWAFAITFEAFYLRPR